jgi:FlaA1/EpsC-like NDP-sugar epimerase
MAHFKGKPIVDKDLEILLCGEEPDLQDASMASRFDNEVVLVTGAAGSIGSEIARQLAVFNCRQLILLDFSESNLYELEQELIQSDILNFVLEIADIRDLKRLRRVFDQYKPSIVFHAAAYKHVPLMENNPNEAVTVNVIGTKNVADLAIEFGVVKCVLISTDKAVNPTSVMGATKRIAELYLNCLNGRGHTQFISARFGNVIGSSGSVIPLFKRQLQSGGPLTVTHKDISRYFMTTSMARYLVLQASMMGKGGEIFVYKIGQPIMIFDLARKMIHLSGLKFPEDITINITGLRPGEKMSEELHGQKETLKPTSHEKILRIETNSLKKEIVEAKINNLCIKNDSLGKLQIVALMKNIVPEYLSSNSKFQLLDSLDGSF